VNLDPSQLFDDSVTWLLQALKAGTGEGIKAAVARWFSRGDDDAEQTVLSRLDRTADVLGAAPEGPEGEGVLNSQHERWVGRFEDAYSDWDGDQQAVALEELRSLLEEHARAAGAQSGDGGVSVAGNMSIKAEGGSIAAAIINGGASIGSPSQPTSSQS
jgi:hypothetical protein